MLALHGFDFNAMADQTNGQTSGSTGTGNNCSNAAYSGTTIKTIPALPQGLENQIWNQFWQVYDNIVFSATGGHIPATPPSNPQNTAAHNAIANVVETKNKVYQALLTLFSGMTRNFSFLVKHNKTGELYGSPSVDALDTDFTASRTENMVLGASFGTNLGATYSTTLAVSLTISFVPKANENAGFDGPAPPKAVSKIAPCQGGSGQAVGRRYVPKYVWTAAISGQTLVAIFNVGTTQSRGGTYEDHNAVQTVLATPS
jgi:hypothetical protein